MSRTSLRRVSPAMILATVALFVALGGGAYAGVALNEVRSPKPTARDRHDDVGHEAARRYLLGQLPAGGAESVSGEFLALLSHGRHFTSLRRQVDMSDHSVGPAVSFRQRSAPLAPTSQKPLKRKA